MKQTTFHKIVLILLVMSFWAGCSSESVEAESTYDTYNVKAETITEELLDSEIIETLEADEDDGLGKVQPGISTPGNSIEIDFAPEEYYLNPENYEVYHFEGLEYGSDIILIPNTEIHDFKFFLLDVEYQLSNVEYKISEILYTSNDISLDKPFVTRIYIAGPGGPYYGVSFLDEYGNQYSYVIYESGEDGSFYLEPI